MSPDQTPVAAAERTQCQLQRSDKQSNEAAVKDESKPEDIPVGPQGAMTQQAGVQQMPQSLAANSKLRIALL